MFNAVARASLRSSRTALRATTGISLARRCLTQEHRAIIQKAITSTPVVLFMKGTYDDPQCGFSRAVVQMLDVHGVPPEKIKAYNVLADNDLRAGIKEFSEWPTVPQVYVNGEFVGGCDILMGMHQSGELEDMLVKQGIIPELIPESESASPSS
jgi:monothiol glutaredoxin